MAEHSRALAHHFENLEQQRDAGELGMWLFLTTEIMFFGGLFLAYCVFRAWYPAEFVAGSETMDVTLGTINTAVLLTSSLSMALAVRAAGQSQRRRLVALLVATTLLGVVFLGIKSYEYHHKYEEGLIPFGGFPFAYDTGRRAGLVTFLNLYFLMTGLHAFHMVVGIFMLLALAVLAWRGGLLGERSLPVHNIGLYWHFVDLVWVYLFPFFYLIAVRSGGH
ncbi:MAG: cytochrome c oxidase subunit 3 [Pirellulaceae bacterium]